MGTGILSIFNEDREAMMTFKEQVELLFDKVQRMRVKTPEQFAYEVRALEYLSKAIAWLNGIEAW